MDLFLNLFAEALGILATVFLVDRLLKRREQVRWQPFKQTALIQLFDVSTKIIFSVVPRSLIDLRTIDINFYKFGTSYRHILLDEKQLINLLGVFRKTMEASMKDAYEYKPEMVNVLQSCEMILGNIMSQASFILDPDIMEFALTLQNAIQEIHQSDLLYVLTNKSEFDPELATVNLNVILVTAIFLRLTIIKQKDKIVLAEEYSQDLRTTFKDLFPEEKGG